MLVVVHHRGCGLQRWHIDPVELTEPLACHLLVSGALQVEPQVGHRPLAPMDVVVVLATFLNGSVGEVNKHVVQLTGAGCVIYCAEVAKPKLILHATVQWVGGRHQDREAQVKLQPVSNGL